MNEGMMILDPLSPLDNVFGMPYFPLFV